MKVLHATKAYFPHLGGIETVVKQLADDAAGRGHQAEVLVTTPGFRSRSETIDQVSVRRVAAPLTISSLPLSPRFHSEFASRTADVLVIHEPSLLAAASLRVRPDVRGRFESTVVWWHSDIHRQRLAAPVYTPLFERLLDHADRIVAATPHHIDSSPFLSRYRHKTNVIPFGVPLHEFVPTVERLARAEALRPVGSGMHIVAIGRLVPYKGHRHLLDALVGVEGATLTLIGDGPGHDEIVAHEACRAGRARLVPSLPRRQMLDYLYSADVFAFPSIHKSEAFGISQVEAMACGVPVVCFDLPTGVSWVNRHMESGLVCRLADTADLRRALQRLVDEPALRSELAHGALARARAVFDERFMLDAFDDLASSLATEPTTVGTGR